MRASISVQVTRQPAAGVREAKRARNQLTSSSSTEGSPNAKSGGGSWDRSRLGSTTRPRSAPFVLLLEHVAEGRQHGGHRQGSGARLALQFGAAVAQGERLGGQKDNVLAQLHVQPLLQNR